MAQYTLTRAGRTWHFVAGIANDSVMVGVRYPSSIAIAPDGHIFVLSRGMPTENPDALGNGGKIGKWHLDGTRIGDYARNEFTWTSGIAVAADGDVYCADEHDNFIAAFPPDGPFRPFPEFNPDGEFKFKWGEPGSADGQLNSPSGLVFDQHDDLLVVDSRNNRVQKFTKEGVLLSGWGTNGVGEGEFDRPWGICVDKAGFVYVADWGNHRVQKITPDGEYVMTFGSHPD
jgi:DNA-binding beta-propeller fold protein YncE